MHVPVRLVLEHLAGAPPATLETVHDNLLWPHANPRLSIVIPSYRHDASPLVALLAATPRALAIEIVVYDDGSSDDALLARMADAADRALAPVRIVSSLASRGRTAARNRAITHARAPWVLMLDADMAPDHKRFVEIYLDAIATAPGPAVIVGGYTLKQAPDGPRFALHRWRARTSKCLTAAPRTAAAGHHVLSSNFVAHIDVLAACPFDETFAGSELIASNRFPIIHIDNTATHLGLDNDKAWMSKYARSGANVARLAARHPRPMANVPIYRAANIAKGLPFRPLLAAAAGRIASSHGLPVALRGRALKAWRALLDAGDL